MTDVTANLQVCHSCRFRQKPGVLCTRSGKPFFDHAENHTCPEARFAARGIGDRIEKVLHWTGADKVVAAVTSEPCVEEPGETLTPCQKRRDFLNRIFSAEGSD